MEHSNLSSSLVFRTFSVGLVGGLRSWPPLAALALTYGKTFRKNNWRSWPVFRSEVGRRVLIALGLTEFVTDKLPSTQPRLELKAQPHTIDTGLIGRTAAVALVGAAIGSEEGEKNSVVAGAALAAAGAIIGNYTGYYGRKATVEATGLPDNSIALIEDVITLAALSVIFHRR